MTQPLPRRPVEAVLFDAGQTLVHVYPSVGAVYAEVAAAHGVTASSDALESAFRSLWRYRRTAFPDDLGYASSEALERAWWYGLVKDVFAAADALDGFEERFDAFFEDVYERFAEAEPWRVFDDVIPCLDVLESRGLRCAIVSNWDRRLPLLLERLGLRRRFECVVTSAEVGRRKPHPRIFEHALERLGLSPDRVLHVGDSHDEDVVGARQAGITALLIDRQGSATPGTGVITRLDDVNDILS